MKQTKKQLQEEIEKLKAENKTLKESLERLQDIHERVDKVLEIKWFEPLGLEKPKDND